MIEGSVETNSGNATLEKVESKPASADQNIKDLVEQARISVLAQIKDEAETARELGRQRGLQEGRQTGVAEVKQEFAAEFGRIKSLADKLPQALEAGIDGLEDVAVAIAFESVCKILGGSAVTLEGVQAIVRQVTQQASKTEKLVVRLHPGDLEILRNGGVLETILSSSTSNAVSWLPDNSVALGGCMIETDRGSLDARLETQIEKLRGVLLGARSALNTPFDAISPGSTTLP